MCGCLTPQHLIFPLCHTSRPLPVLPEQTKFRSHIQAMMTCPCHTFKVNPIISKSELEILWLCVLVWPAQENVYFEICLSQNGWMFLIALHTWTMLNWRCRVITSSHSWDCPFTLSSQFGVYFKEGVKAISRSMEAINRAQGFSQLTMFMFFWGCAATVVGNYSCVGEDAY